MDDRELLELAAKAAGIAVQWKEDGRSFQVVRGLPFTWNPLTDDGDALRLACALGLTVECDFHDSDTCTAYQTRGDIVADEQAGMLGEVIGEPDFAATRRAIVRAAAEIGRAM
jgi:hypothetical protein